MKYRVTQPFIAFGKTPEVGDVVELTDEQAELLAGMDNVTPYEIKIQPKPENKMVKKPSGSAPVARPSHKKTAKRYKKTAKK
jgi:hypothetical protein